MARTMRPLWIIFGLWCAFICFAPITLHTYFVSEGGHHFLGVFLRNYQYIALATLLLLVLCGASPKWKPWRVLSLKLTNIIGYAVLATIACQFAYLMITNTQLVTGGGTTITADLAVLTFMIVSNKLKSLSEPTSILIGVLAGLFVIAALELPYQFLFREHNVAEMTFIIRQMSIMILSFIIACVLYRLIPNKVGIALLCTTLVCYLLWVFPLNRWTFTGAEVINWPVYQMAKSLRVQLALALTQFHPWRVANKQI